MTSSYKVKRDHPFLKILERNLFSFDKVQPIYTESVGDENVFAEKLIIPVISIGPIGEGDHTAREWVRITSIKEVLLCYQKILTLYCRYRA